MKKVSRFLLCVISAAVGFTVFLAILAMFSRARAETFTDKIVRGERMISAYEASVIIRSRGGYFFGSDEIYALTRVRTDGYGYSPRFTEREIRDCAHPCVLALSVPHFGVYGSPLSVNAMVGRNEFRARLGFPAFPAPWFAKEEFAERTLPLAWHLYSLRARVSRESERVQRELVFGETKPSAALAVWIAMLLPHKELAGRTLHTSDVAAAGETVTVGRSESGALVVGAASGRVFGDRDIVGRSRFPNAQETRRPLF